MRLISIYPLMDTCLEYTQTTHMFLTHLVEKYPMYAKIARDVSGYKILDNSLIELGKATSIKRILKAAEMIGADEIILPDVFQDRQLTLEAVDRAWTEIDYEYAGKCPYKLMGVAQGKDWREWDYCYEALMNDPHVDVVGIPKICAKMLPGGRPAVMRKSQCRLHEKPHHLLGLWYSTTEFGGYEHLEAIRSCDTVLPSFLAKYQLSPMGVRPDGFTIDLENDLVDPNNILRCDTLIREMISNIIEGDNQ